MSKLASYSQQFPNTIEDLSKFVLVGREKLNSESLRRSHTYKKQICYVCEAHRLITELHHVLSLEDCALFLNLMPDAVIDVPLVWLCPNHHRYIHVFVKDPNAVIPMLSEIEIEKLIELNNIRILTIKKLVGGATCS